jgi:predicted DNA-binding transcriptional regulator AlpA
LALTKNAEPEQPAERFRRNTMNTQRRVKAETVRQLCGGVSDMTIWRWLQSEDFPKPIYIGRRRYWREADVIDWMNAREAEAA